MKIRFITKQVCIGHIRRGYGLDNVIENTHDNGSVSYTLFSDRFSYGCHLEKRPELDIDLTLTQFSKD